MSSTSSPRRLIFTGGSSKPSWKTSVASPESPPGVFAPTSDMCATLATKATSSPSQKTGFSSMCSGTWPEPRYGSLWRTTSPSLERVEAELLDRPVDRELDRADLRGAELRLGEHVAPAGSKITHEKSSDSLKIGEYAVVIIVTPMSRQLARQVVVDDGQRDRIEAGASSCAPRHSSRRSRAARLAARSTVMPGSTRVVEPSSSITAGPSMARRARARSGAYDRRRRIALAADVDLALPAPRRRHRSRP